MGICICLLGFPLIVTKAAFTLDVAGTPRVVEREVTKVVTVEKVVTAMPEPKPAEPVTLRVGVTTIWDAINPATGWESYTLCYWFHDGLIE